MVYDIVLPTLIVSIMLVEDEFISTNHPKYAEQPRTIQKSNHMTIVVGSILVFHA
jgi:hypothetical protein